MGSMNITPEVALGIRFEIDRAVIRAMIRAHETNPAGYHSARPKQPTCPTEELCPFNQNYSAQ
jgi:hypothetical protein